jgi:hypothetical protein
MNMREQTLEEKINDLKHSMTNQTPDEEKIKRIEIIRESYKKTGEEILRNCPQSRHLSIAITCLEESLHRAVKSIALEGF